MLPSSSAATRLRTSRRTLNPSSLKRRRSRLSRPKARQANVPEPVISSDASPELSTEVELVVAEEALVSSIDIEIAPVDAPALAVNDDTSSDVADVEPTVVEDSCVALADSDVSAEEVSENSIDSAPFPVVATEIEPVPANDPARSRDRRGGFPPTHRASSRMSRRSRPSSLPLRRSPARRRLAQRSWNPPTAPR